MRALREVLMHLYFLLGEKRRIWLEVSSHEGDAFVIRNAAYSLERYREVIDTGECVIDEHNIAAMVQPPERGEYNLIFSFEIGGEIMKEKVVVVVE